MTEREGERRPVYHLQCLSLLEYQAGNFKTTIIMLKALMKKVDNMCFSRGMEMVRKELNKNATKKKAHEWSYRML